MGCCISSKVAISDFIEGTNISVFSELAKPPVDYLNNFLLLCTSILDFSAAWSIKGILSGALPYLAALIVFLIVTLFCFAPQFEGKVLSQHDILQYDGMTEDILQHREAFGEDPQWEGNMFSLGCLPT